MTAHPVKLSLRPVALAQTASLAEYARVVGEDVIDELETLARPLRGARVAHISATAQGGGVAELLQTLVPLMQRVGLEAEWRVMTGSDAFFTVTKAMHNGLQGMPLDLTADMQALYQEVNAANAASFDVSDFDFVVVHDPQPAPLRALLSHTPPHGSVWVWRCHLDLTAANPAVWQFLRPFLQPYDAAIFTMASYVLPDLPIASVHFIPPAIDPLSPKNAPMSEDMVAGLVARRQVDPSRPLLVQVSRYDPWKDPMGVIDMYRTVRERISTLQLVLLGAMAHDDPEGETYYRRTLQYADGDPDIHVLLNTHGSPEVNAFQRQAAVVVQKSLREGFGLTVTEGLWKARPVVAGRVGGIPLQIEDGVSGYLVESITECAERVLQLLREPEAAREMGARGRERVRRQFLSTANLRNYLLLFGQFV